MPFSYLLLTYLPLTPSTLPSLYTVSPTPHFHLSRSYHPSLPPIYHAPLLYHPHSPYFFVLTRSPLLSSSPLFLSAPSPSQSYLYICSTHSLPASLPPVLRPSLPSCVPPVLRPSRLTSLPPYPPPVLRPSLPASLPSCVPPVLHPSRLASLMLISSLPTPSLTTAL